MRRVLFGSLGIAIAVVITMSNAGQATFPGSAGRIAFQAQDGATTRIYTMLPNGTDRQALTPAPGRDAHNPAWSSDGTKIAYTIGVGFHARVLVMNADGSNKTVVFEATSAWRDLDCVAWSPDGTTLAVCASDRYAGWRSRLILVPATGGTGTPVGILGDTHPSWSPDGTRLAVAHRGRHYTWHIVTMLVDGSDRHVIGSGWQPDWSPTGDTVAYTWNDVFIVNADGTDRHRLTHSPAQNEYAPTWSPDGTRIAFTRDVRWVSEVFVQRIDRRDAIQITNTKRTDEYNLDWQPVVP